MKEWIENNLLTNKGNISKSKATAKWFVDNNFLSQLESLNAIDKDPLLASSFIMGKAMKCRECDKLVLMPRVYCSYKCSASSKEGKEQRLKSANSEEVKKKRKETMLQRYGVDNAFRSDEFKEKARNTMLQKYGVEYSSQSKELRDKSKETLMSRYGTDHQMRAKEVKDKVKKTNLERYGVEYGMSSPIIRDKVKKTLMDRYGVENTFSSELILAKCKGTMLQRYGTPHALQVEEFKNKARETNIERHGVAYPFATPEAKKKSEETTLIRYGVRYSLQSPVVQDKIKKTNSERYGVENVSQIDFVKEKIKKNNKEKYGVYHYSQKHYPYNLKMALDLNLSGISGINDPIFNCTSYATRYNLIHAHRPDIEFEKFISLTEKELREYVKSFGLDVESNKRDVLGNGQEIDIYIPSLKLGFEFNGTYWHSDKQKPIDYHQKKSIVAKDKGITLIHLYEFDGIDRNKEIISEHLNGTYKPEFKNIDGMLYHNLDRGSISNLNEHILHEAVYTSNDLNVFGAGYELIKESHVL